MRDDLGRSAVRRSAPPRARVLAIAAVTLSGLTLPAGSVAATAEPATVRASATRFEVPGNDASCCAAVSLDGSVVAFASRATNLHPADNDSFWDIFVYDRNSPDRIELISKSSGNTKGRAHSYAPSISDDGRRVAFHSQANNLDPADVTECEHPPQPDRNCTDVFLRDRSTNTTTLLSRGHLAATDHNGAFIGLAGGQGDSFDPDISPDGRHVAFTSHAPLYEHDSNGLPDVYVWDEPSNSVHRVSVDSDERELTGRSFQPSISSGGLRIAFVSSDVTLEGNVDVDDVYVRNRDRDGDKQIDPFLQGQTVLASVSTQGRAANRSSYWPSISDDGFTVAFTTTAFNLVNQTPQAPVGTDAPVGLVCVDRVGKELCEDTNRAEDVFVRNISTGETTRVSVSSAGAEGNGSSTFPAISGSGQFVAFYSDATNLVAGDGNGVTDTFIHNRATGVTSLASIRTDGRAADRRSGDGSGGCLVANDPTECGGPFISPDGTYVVFESAANLTERDEGPGNRQVYLRNRGECDASGHREPVRGAISSRIRDVLWPSLAAVGPMRAGGLTLNPRHSIFDGLCTVSTNEPVGEGERFGVGTITPPTQ